MADSGGSDSEWEETERQSPPPCLCLFCSTQFGGAEAVLEHCSQEHNFILYEVISTLGKAKTFTQSQPRMIAWF